MCICFYFFLRRALNFCMAAVMALVSAAPLSAARGTTEFVSCCCTLPRAAASASPAFLAPFLRGKTTSLDTYAFRRATLTSLDSTDLRRRWSTLIPMVRAVFASTLASRSSSRVKPLPRRARVLYLMVAQRTLGRRVFRGRGATAAAFSARAARREALRMAWLWRALGG